MIHLQAIHLENTRIKGAKSMSNSRAPPPVAVDDSMLMALGLMSVLPVASLPDSALGHALSH